VIPNLEKEEGEMRTKSKWLALTMAFLLPLALACGPRDEAVEDDETMIEEGDRALGEPRGTEPMGTERETDLMGEAQQALDDFTMGHGVEADGSIPLGELGDDFEPGETVYLAMEAEPSEETAGQNIRVVVYGPDGAEVASEEKPFPAAEGYVNFQWADTANWAAGEYRAEIWLGGEKVNEQEFNIGDEAGA
jgi:hypothetical protein